MAKHIHILCIASEHIYTEVISAIGKFFLNRNDVVTIEHAFKKEPEKPFSNDINIVIKAQRKFNINKLPKQSLKILFQSEQFSKLRKFDSLPYSEGYDLVLDVFQTNIERALDEKIVSSELRFLPIGYHRAYRNHTDSIHITEDELGLDCYFFGARTDYRKTFWQKYVTPYFNNCRNANADLRGEKYFNITHSKINLFIPGWEPYYVPTMHTIQVLANRKFLIVVSDTQQDFAPYQPGLHFALTTRAKSTDLIKAFLKHPEDRKRFEQKCFDDLIANHTFDGYLDRALQGFI